MSDKSDNQQEKRVIKPTRKAQDLGFMVNPKQEGADLTSCAKTQLRFDEDEEDDAISTAPSPSCDILSPVLRLIVCFGNGTKF